VPLAFKDVCNHPEILALTRAIFREHGMPEQDMEDHIQETHLRTSKVEPFPETIDGAKALYRKIAHDVGVSWLRMRDARRNTNVGATDQADEHADSKRVGSLEPVDARRAAAAATSSLTDQQLELVDRRMAGESFADIGRDRGVTSDKVEREFQDVKKTARKALNARRITIAALGLVGASLAVALYLRSHFRDDQAQNVVDSGPSAVPSAPPPPSPTALANAHEAQELRKSAKQKFGLQDYRGCLQDLADADKLDPDAGAAPEWQDMATAAVNAIPEQELNSKHRRRDGGASIAPK
jgi:DNA-directed RNA polymerase specialized sigma24 family protein